MAGRRRRVDEGKVTLHGRVDDARVPYEGAGQARRHREDDGAVANVIGTDAAIALDSRVVGRLDVRSRRVANDSKRVAFGRDIEHCRVCAETYVRNTPSKKGHVCLTVGHAFG